ncbi:MAG: hypothetical protein GQF41_1919 [Candidatus Rifleibacterium amylolyticum]|nr:MAG: hypothetical protein GQF41_1919 [Candidatus Rifleibacterium amylolyticum]
MDRTLHTLYIDLCGTLWNGAKIRRYFNCLFIFVLSEAVLLVSKAVIAIEN